MDTIQPFLDRVYLALPTPSSRPSVTLTFAQSLDGRIGLPNKSTPLILSGPLSSTLTHSLRTRHDAILIGVDTLLSDNPSLNARSPPLPLSDPPSAYHQPIPIILDTRLKAGTNYKILKNAREGVGVRPVWVCIQPQEDDAEWKNRRDALLKEGALDVIILPPNKDGHIPVPTLLERLANFEPKIKSVMVEGGSKIIRSFLRSGCVDRLIVTIAPVLVGPQGVPGFAWDGSQDEILPTLTTIGSLILGNDVIIACNTGIE